MAELKDLIRSVLATVREVEEWREEYDPGTAEWNTLLNLSDEVLSLIDRLPPELLPDEKVRGPAPKPEPQPFEFDGPPPTVDELIEFLGL
ncbi:hypothetical protein [Streptomyces sp. NPDC055036]